MGLFTISCHTCTSRLVVQNESAIGQVLACPKCGSMVEVVPPPEWQPSDPEINQANTGAAGSTTTAPQINVRQKTAGQAPQPKPPDAATAPVLPTDQWTSETAKKRRKAIGLIAGIVAIAALILASVGYLISQNTSDRLADASPDPASETSGDATDPSDPAHDSDPSIDEDNSDAENPAPSNSEASEDNEVESGDPVNGDEATTDVPDRDVEADSDTSTRGDDNTADDASESTGSESEPFDIQPDGQLSIDKAPPDDSMIDALDDIGSLLFDEPIMSATEFSDLTTDLEDGPVGIGKVFIAKPEPLRMDLAAALNQPVSGLRYHDVALIDFLRFFFQLTAIPVSLDVTAVAEGRLDPLQKVTIDQVDSTAGELLQQALGELGLTYEIIDDVSVLLVTPQLSETEKRSYDLPAPLLADEETLKHLVTAIQVSISPQSWNVNEGEGSIEIKGSQLEIDHNPSIHARVQRLLDLLAAAQAVKTDPRSNAAAAETLKTLHTRSRELLTSSSSFRSIQADPIGTVLGQVGRADGVTVLVDWPAVAVEGWNPRTEIPWPASDSDIESTVRDIALSMELNSMTLADDTLLITTPRNVRYLPRIEVYPLGHLINDRLTGEGIFRLLERGIAASIPPNSDTYVYFDERFQCIVAVLPEFLHIRAERILEQLDQRQRANAGN